MAASRGDLRLAIAPSSVRTAPVRRLIRARKRRRIAAALT